MEEEKIGYRGQEDAREPAYYATIPANVRYDPELRPSAKLLYGELTALCDKTGYCWASNRYFAQLYGLAESTISTLLKDLEKRGHIRREVVRNERNEVVERRIYAGVFIVIPSPQKRGEGSPQKRGEGSPQKRGEPPIENAKENNTSIIDTSNNPPKAPQGGRRRREPKKAPDWKPERFAAFWKYYPRGESKQATIAAWDRLKPDDELIDTIARALKRQKASEEWQRGIGIPHASTYLNQRRWEDEKRDQPPPDPPETPRRRHAVWT